MTDLRTAMISAHKKNIDRYCRLLNTQLTDEERQYIHKRIVEERASLERWEMRTSPSEAVSAAAALVQSSGQQ